MCFGKPLCEGTRLKEITVIKDMDNWLGKHYTRDKIAFHKLPDSSGPEDVEAVNIDFNLSSFWTDNVEMLQREAMTRAALLGGFNHNFSPTTSNQRESLLKLFNCSSTLNCPNFASNISIPWNNSQHFLTDNSEQTLSLESSSSQSNDSLDKLLNQSNLYTPTFVNISNLFATQNLSSNPDAADLRVHHPVLAVFLGLLCLMVMFGNILIMVAIRRERYLHTVTNLFVASLAVADCLVGAIVMPSSVVHEVMNKWWIFGQDWCDIWHSFDVLASTASILNLCVISLDRYWAITDPISYPARMTPRKAKILIAFIWTCSAIISFPAILWWRAVSPPSPPLRCDFTEDTSYLVTSSIISFYGPLVIMLFVYFRIYRAAVQQTKSFRTGLKSIPSNGGDENKVVLRVHRGGGNQVMGCGPEGAPLKARVQGQISFEDGADYSENGLDIKVGSVRHRNMKAFSISRKVAKLAKERKAAKTLGIVMGVFILCWLPFFMANMVKGLCKYLVSHKIDSINKQTE